MVGVYEAQGLVDGSVVGRRHQSVLQPVSLRDVVVDVVGGDYRRTGLGGQRGQVPVAPGVALREVLLEFHVHCTAAVPVQPVAQ